MEKQRLWDWFDRLTMLWRKTVGQGRTAVRLELLSPQEIITMAQALKVLNKGLAKSRSLPGQNYMEKPETLGAYLHYYWPSSYAQASNILEKSYSGPKKKALDLGSGPGPVAMALLDHGFEEVWAADRSKKALEFTERAAPFAKGTLKTFRWDLEKEGLFPYGRFDLIVLSHVYNELYHDHPDRDRLRYQKIQALEPLLSPGGKILIIEPAQKETATDLLRLRDHLADQEWKIKAPCFFQGPCPLLALDSPCFAEFTWYPPPTFTRLAHGARIERSTLKTAYLLLEAPDGKPVARAKAGADATLFITNSPYRVIGQPMKNKAGRTRIPLCGPGGRFTLSDEAESKVLESVKRHEVIEVSLVEVREGGVGLTAESRVKREAKEPPLSSAPKRRKPR